MSSHVQMTSFVNVCDVKSAKKLYACLRIVNNKTKKNMTCASSHLCLGSPVVRKKEFLLKRFISLEEINLSRQKQNYRFYLFDKSWYFPAKHVIYYLYPLYEVYFKIGVIYIFNCYTSKLKVKKKHTLTFRYFLLNGGVPYGKSDYLPDWNQ